MIVSSSPPIIPIVEIVNTPVAVDVKSTNIPINGYVIIIMIDDTHDMMECIVARFLLFASSVTTVSKSVIRKLANPQNNPRISILIQIDDVNKISTLFLGMQKILWFDMSAQNHFFSSFASSFRRILESWYVTNTAKAVTIIA